MPEFHTELELIFPRGELCAVTATLYALPRAQIQNRGEALPQVAHVLQLELWLMEGCIHIIMQSEMLCACLNAVRHCQVAHVLQLEW